MIEVARRVPLLAQETTREVLLLGVLADEDHMVGH